jgi:hypothetical protein
MYEGLERVKEVPDCAVLDFAARVKARVPVSN